MQRVLVLFLGLKNVPDGTDFSGLARDSLMVIQWEAHLGHVRRTYPFIELRKVSKQRRAGPCRGPRR